MAGIEITHIVLMPPDVINTEIVSNVATIINKDLYSTRLLLNGKIPKLIAHYPNFKEAETITQRLKAIGLAVVTCEDAFLHQPPDVFKVHTIKISDDVVTFQNQLNETTRIKPKQVFLLLKGSCTSYIETKTTVTQVKLSMGKTLIMGGIPVFNKKNEEVTNRSENIELFLRIYNTLSAEKVIELSQMGLDYSFLGEKRSFSSLTNFNSAVGEIRKLFTNAIFDDRLTRTQGTETSPITASNNTEVNCKLLYLCYRRLQ
jgi:hypothetical protein